MNCTHILLIQVWSETLNQVVSYGNVLNYIKEKIVNNKDNIQTQEIELHDKKEMYKISWEKINLPNKDKFLYNSDIICITNIDDTTIYKHTQKMLQEIEDKMNMKQFFNFKCNIIFSIVKPIKI